MVLYQSNTALLYIYGMKHGFRRQILEHLGETDKTMMVILWNDGPTSNPFLDQQEAIMSLGLDETLWHEYQFLL